MKKSSYMEWKKFIDLFLSLLGVLFLAPLFLFIMLVIKLDSKGPIFFRQKRVGIHKKHFYILKFRTMRIDTPKDVPTHLLTDPEQYITKAGKFLRKTSLDELPQILNILKGDMCIIGPRPALWNQYDLIEERDKYGANDVMPGLTGWAQINGRDELEIPVKARLDGEYVKHLRQGGIKALFFDAKCFFGTIRSVASSKGVVEGGTGEMYRKSSVKPINEHRESRIKSSISVNIADTGFEDYGYKKTFHIDKAVNKRVLITGANSYIGESLVSYVEAYYPNINIDTLDMIGEGWRAHDFKGYDSVFHVAGIAHADVEKIDKRTKKKYYAVNTDLAVEVAKTARAAGVSQFIFMSSMIIYGDSVLHGKRVIDEHTVPSPANFYGDSKWQADKGVRALQSDDFHVAVLRPPMIYGKGSKGNYPVLSKIARNLKVFPDIDNNRSMLYIDNFCEFVSMLLLSGEGGIYFPQNREYSSTSDLVKKIALASGKKIYITSLLKPVVFIGSKIPGKLGTLVKKAFGSSVYSKKISTYEGLDYHVKTLKESITATEKAGHTSVLILVNHDIVVYNFRLELVERLLADGYEVHISSPYGERIDDLIALGAKYHEIRIDRHGMNPAGEMKILKNYQSLIKEVHPVIVLGYTIKPNIYGAIAARQAHVPFVANITGLGTALVNGRVRQQLTLALYHFAFKNIYCVFFQNTEDERFFRRHHIALGKHKLLPGSGVNLKRYPPQPYPLCGDGKCGAPVKFAFISRIMKEKGIDQYLCAAEAIKKRFPNTEFHVCGFCEKEYKGRLKELNASGIVIYHGMVRDVAEIMSEMHCIVHPTYYPEGLSNVLLEACSCGRPVITTDRSGCREVVMNGVNGYMVKEKDVTSLIASIEKFLKLSLDEKGAMGQESRKIVEDKYSREIVVERYMKEITAVSKRAV